MISTPQLPPKAGYIEVVGRDGSHSYKKIETEEAQKMTLMQAQIQAQSDRAEFIEDCIAEMAMQVYGEA